MCVCVSVHVQVILCVNDVKLFVQLLDGEGERKEVGVISSETGEEGTITNDDDDDEINEEISESVSLSLVIVVLLIIVLVTD